MRRSGSVAVTVPKPALVCGALAQEVELAQVNRAVVLGVPAWVPVAVPLAEATLPISPPPVKSKLLLVVSRIFCGKPLAKVVIPEICQLSSASLVARPGSHLEAFGKLYT